MTTLTTRQESILALIEAGRGAREIADELGVSRNAVYQQITALKKKGVLTPTFTLSGETRIPAPANGAGRAEEVMQYLTNEHAAPAQVAALDVIRELVEMNRQLVQVVADLSAQK